MLADSIDKTSCWFAAVKQQPDSPAYNAQQVAFYLGMQIEELAEKLELLLGNCDGVMELVGLADEFKKAPPELITRIDSLLKSNPKAAADWVDADCDQIWVSIGAIRALGIEPSLPYGEVERANWGKRWGDGTFHHDANGKVLKPEGWKEPDHARFVTHLANTKEPQT